MVDLHTHILPGMDDGAENTAESIMMLRAEAKQGVTKVALTPHFYPDRESAEAFLERRRRSIDALTAAAESGLPELITGAEVAWVPGLDKMAELEKLCYDGTRLLLVELPTVRWDSGIFRSLDEISMMRGITPVIAHIDRCFSIETGRNLEELLHLELPLQISAEAMLLRFGARKMMRFALENGCALVSDCHGTVRRTPNIQPALEAVRKKLGRNAAKELSSNADKFMTL